MSESTTQMTREESVATIARCCHEANRAWCAAHGDLSQAPWDEAPDWQRESAAKGVEGAINGNGPEQSHLSWLAEKEATGWVYGAVKDPDAKTHPCMVSYDQLPPMQRAKDAQFIAICRALIPVLGLAPAADIA